MSATHDAIDQASATARVKMARVEREAIASLETLYRDAADQLIQDIARLSAADGTLQLTVLQSYLEQVRAVLQVIKTERGDLLLASLQRAAELGAAVWATGPAIDVLAVAAVQFVDAFTGADGLKLSDRLWRLDQGAQQSIAETLRRNILLGRDASKAAAEWVARDEAVPLAIRQQAQMGTTERLGAVVAERLHRAPGSAYADALRVFRTEMNRAHGQAYQAGAAGHPDVIGMKFNLSPSHPRTDQCDLHAHANLHGLGDGVYPVGQAPWPAHPNTMSYLTAVFRDEVSTADRAGKADRLNWLRNQPEIKQDQLLGKAKATALRAGMLNEADIYTPWRDLKRRYEQRGYQFD